jgi:hypothetical protein
MKSNFFLKLKTLADVMLVSESYIQKQIRTKVIKATKVKGHYQITLSNALIACEHFDIEAPSSWYKKLGISKAYWKHGKPCKDCGRGCTCPSVVNPEIEEEAIAALIEITSEIEDKDSRIWHIANNVIKHIYSDGIEVIKKPESIAGMIPVEFCEHANEVPQRCPCLCNCYCRIKGSCVR